MATAISSQTVTTSDDSSLAPNPDVMQVDPNPPAKNSDRTSTRTQNTKAPSAQPFQRVRRVSPRTLDQFTNSHELVYVVAGAVRAHERLYKEAGVLHGDINPNTILILDWPASEGDSDGAAQGKARTEGALVDFDVPYSLEGIRQLVHPWPYKFS
ncbi:hypothetical protein K466DRAFT_586512 [Polyporus arcularius HHB13444]|uniref:Fungal-type protein kinase domain-containing protein n=1 Tax=Polyporus arcularius HHB13444 TaxID=1314778 RepID=A0A5C3PCA1_9APHY|nr:hypothetical protein K466DRAFT_586512 [Polyporus arcularius HHB13444]